MISAAESGKTSFMINGAILALLTFLIGCIIFPLCIYLKVRIIKHVMVNIRLDVFRHVEQLPISYHDSTHSGELTSILINDINLIKNTYNDQMQMLGISLIGGIGSAIVMFSLDWRLSIITIIIGIISARINISYASPLREIGNKIQNSLGVLNQHLGDIILGSRTSKMFNISSIVTERFITESNKIAFTTIQRVHKNSLMSGINYLFGDLSMIGIYIVGAIKGNIPKTVYGSREYVLKKTVNSSSVMAMVE